MESLGNGQELASPPANEADLQTRYAYLSKPWELGSPVHASMGAKDINNILRSTIPGLSPPFHIFCQDDWITGGKVRWQGISQDDCNQWTGYNLSSEEWAGRIKTSQPATFKAFLMQRHWEPTSSTGAPNLELFSRQVRLEGIRIAKEAFRLAAAGIVDEAQLPNLETNLGNQLGLWLDSLQTDSRRAQTERSVRSLLQKALELTPSLLSSVTLSADQILDGQRKADVVSCMQQELSLTSFFILTDGSWGSLGPYRRDPEIGNFNLGRDMASKMAPALGLSYDWADFNPLKLEKNMLIERLGWWRSFIDSALANPADLAAGIRDLLQVPDNAQVSGINSLGLADEKIRNELASAACDKLNGFIADLQSDEKGARLRLQDFLVYLSQHRREVSDKSKGRGGVISMPLMDADLLAHIALGQLSRLVGIGSLRSPALELTYSIGQSKSSTQFNPFTNMLEVKKTLCVQGGPSPFSEAESRKFIGWLQSWIREHNPAFKDIGPLVYNSSSGAYEISLGANLPADYTVFDGKPLLEMRVPSSVYSSDKAQSLCVWSLRGVSELVGPAKKTKSWKTQDEESFKFSETVVSSGHMEFGGATTFFYSSQGAFGGSLLWPPGWEFPSIYRRQQVTKNIFSNFFGHYVGSSAIEAWPVGASYLMESILPGSAMRAKVSEDKVFARPGLSVSDVTRAADASADSMLRFSISESLKKRPDAIKEALVGNIGLSDITNWSLGFHEAFRWYNHSQYFSYATHVSTDKDKRSEFERLNAVCQTRAFSSVLSEFFPGFSVYKPWSVGLDLVGNNMIDALRGQSTWARYVDENLKSHSTTEIFFRPPADLKTDFSLGQRTSDDRDIRAGISAPLSVSLGSSSMLAKFYDATAFVFNHSYDYFLSERASIGFDFSAGALVGFGQSGMNVEVGPYTYTDDEKGKNYPFSIKEKNFKLFPIGRLQLRAAADHVSKGGKTWMGMEGTLQMGPKNFYDVANALASGGRAAANIFGNNPDSFKRQMQKAGFIYSELYGGAKPLNLEPLNSGAEVVEDFTARGMRLSAKDEQALRALKDGELRVIDTRDGYSYTIVAKSGQYTIMPEYDITNSAFGSNWPLIRANLWAGVNLLTGSLGRLRAETGARLNLTAMDTENFYLRAEAQFGGKEQTGPFTLWSQYAVTNPFRGSVPQISAGLRYAPVSTVTDSWLNNFNAALQYSIDTHPGAKVDYLKLTIGYNFRAPNRKTVTEYERVTPITTEWKLNCDDSLTSTIIRGPDSVHKLKDK